MANDANVANVAPAQGGRRESWSYVAVPQRYARSAFTICRIFPVTRTATRASSR